MNESFRTSFDPSRLTKASAADYSSSDSDADEERPIPGQELDDNEFGGYNPRKKRRVGGKGKEKAALGIFASDSEDDKPGSQWKRKTLRSKGMNFVSTNETAAKATDDSESDDTRPALGNGPANGSDDDMDESDGEAHAGIGLGFGSAGGMAGITQQSFPAVSKSDLSKTTAPRMRTSFKGGGVLGVGFVPSSAVEPVLRDDLEAEPTPKNRPQQSAFTSKGKINAGSFGARMMAKMGYVEGKGLGKEGQGRNIIIEANLRPQGAGLGAISEKSKQERELEKRQAEARGETISDSEEEKKKKKAKAKQKRLGTAYSSGTSTPRRQKPKYVTAEELKTNAPGLQIPEAFAPILDMTGPGGKLLRTTTGIMTPTASEQESAEMIETRKLVSRAQADLVAFSEEWRSLEERKTWLNLSLTEKQQDLDEMQTNFGRLKLFSDLVSSKLVMVASWSEATAALKEASRLGAVSVDLSDIVVSVIHPFFKDWDPAANPAQFTSELKDIASLVLPKLDSGDSLDKWNAARSGSDGVFRKHNKATTTYESMMYKCWLPQVLAASRDWDAVDPTPMLSILEAWNDLLPAFVRAQFMESIARKLDETLSSWNPRVKGSSHHLPHTWLFPWLEHLPAYHLDPRGTGLVADVKRKFRHLIDAWDFSRGVIPGFTQWESILGDQWLPLIMSHVLPSMGKYMARNFKVDPADQEPYLAALTGVMRWRALLGDAMVAEVLGQHVMPQWRAKLQEWLSLDEVNLSEVADWYAWWRGVVLKDIIASLPKGNPALVSEMDRGLLVMNMI